MFIEKVGYAREMRTLALISIILFSISAGALTETTNSGNLKSANTSSLPHCVNDEKTLTAIKSQMQEYAEAKRKNGGKKTDADKTSKYREMKHALESDSDEQLMARLAYSEVKAAHCPEFDRQTVGPIAAVIKNRVRTHPDVRSVVFEEDQFASSLNIYDLPASSGKPEAHSNWKEFLCPDDAAAWDIALNAVRNKTTDIPDDVLNYYLYQHSKRFTPPPWLGDGVKFGGSEKFAECVKLIRPKKR